MLKQKVTATELSKMTFCEQQAYYAKERPNFKPEFHRRADRIKYKKMEVQNQKRIAQGNRIHENHEKYNASTDKRCFVATCIYGQEAWQTESLRQYRDKKLMKSWLGKLVVQLYYAVSPVAVKVIEYAPFLRKTVTYVLNKIVGVLA